MRITQRIFHKINKHTITNIARNKLHFSLNWIFEFSEYAHGRKKHRDTLFAGRFCFSTFCDEQKSAQFFTQIQFALRISFLAYKVLEYARLTNSFLAIQTNNFTRSHLILWSFDSTSYDSVIKGKNTHNMYTMYLVLRVENRQDINIVCNIPKYTRKIHMFSPFSLSMCMCLALKFLLCMRLSVYVCARDYFWTSYDLIFVSLLYHASCICDTHIKDICADNSWIGNTGAVRGNWFKYDHAESNQIE